jgi:hypothetical protein
MAADDPTPVPPYVNSSTAPFVYFDVAATFGLFNGAILIEVACQTLAHSPKGVIRELLCTGRLRCTPAGARSLRDALNAARSLMPGACSRT